MSPSDFNAVAGLLSHSLDHISDPLHEKSEVLAAFSAHKDEVAKGSRET